MVRSLKTHTHTHSRYEKTGAETMKEYNEISFFCKSIVRDVSISVYEQEFEWPSTVEVPTNWPTSWEDKFAWRRKIRIANGKRRIESAGGEPPGHSRRTSRKTIESMQHRTVQIEARDFNWIQVSSKTLLLISWGQNYHTLENRSIFCERFSESIRWALLVDRKRDFTLTNSCLEIH